LVLLWAGCAVQPPAVDTAKIDRVLMLIQQRLSYMDDVARIKWSSGASIEDVPRELEIIEAIGREAPVHGLDPAIARNFFSAQIEASKIIQNTRFREWRARNQPAFVNARDLNSEIRPALDALTPAMLAALAEAMPRLQAPGAAAVIEARAAAIVAGIPADAPARAKAVSPLKRIARQR
jgi:chorismate mutase